MDYLKEMESKYPNPCEDKSYEIGMQSLRLWVYGLYNGKTRKYNFEETFSHSHRIAVDANIHFNGCAVAMAVAYLHDVVEDVEGVGIFDVRNKLMEFFPGSWFEFFINQTLQGVMNLTDAYTKEKFPNLNRKQRSKLETKRLIKVSKHSQYLKMLDIKDNFRTMWRGGNFYSVWRKEKLSFLRGIEFDGLSDFNRSESIRCLTLTKSQEEVLNQYGLYINSVGEDTQLNHRNIECILGWKSANNGAATRLLESLVSKGYLKKIDSKYLPKY